MNGWHAIAYAALAFLLIRWLDRKQYPRSACGKFYFTRERGRLIAWRLK